MSFFKRLFRPAPHTERLPEPEIKRLFPKFRWQIFEATFIGYATFYLVRNNLPVVSHDMATALSYSHSQIGDMLALTALSYGIGKFVMGAMSDQSNPRTFMPFDLIITALCNFAFGWIHDYYVHMLLWTLNGFVQGMGWGPCGRSIGHWFSVKERGTAFAFWNIAHNIGGGIVGLVAAYSAGFWGWEYAFFVPGILATIGAIYLLLRLRDTPQSVGLPPIEDYKPEHYAYENLDHKHKESFTVDDPERNLTSRELFVEYILKNKFIWLFAIANFFVYVVRYALLDWGPMYLREEKGATVQAGGMSTFVYEFSGIFSTILMGWFSDRLGGRRGMISLLCMIPIVGAFWGIIVLPEELLHLEIVLFGIVGFFIYPPVMFMAVMGLDFTSKKAVGTAAGFIGLFGYLGRMFQGKFLGTTAAEFGWGIALGGIGAAAVICILLLLFTWNLKPRR